MAKTQSFRSQLKASLKEGEDAFTTARKAKAGDFELPEIDDGSYVCQLSKVSCRVAKTTPIVDFAVVVIKGDFEGTKLSNQVWLDSASDRFDQSISILIKTLKVLNPALEDVLPEMELDEFLDNLEDYCDNLNDSKPIVRCGVKNGKSATTGKPWLGVYFNENLNGEVDPEDEEGNSPQLEKGGGATYNDEDYEVVSVNKRAETVKLKDDEGEVITAPWDECVPFEFEE